MGKKTIIMLCLVLVLVIAAASLLYGNLRDRVDTAGLATVATVAPSTETTPATVPEAPAETVPATEAPDYSAPDFTVLDWEGNARKLSEFVGKPIVLNFWASWCGPCKSEMPEFEAAYEKYGDQIHFVMVNCTAGDSMEDAKAFIEKNGYTFPVYFDTTNEASYVYGANSIPMTIFIDANGDMVTYARGALSGELLEKGIGMIYTVQ